MESDWVMTGRSGSDITVTPLPAKGSTGGTAWSGAEGKFSAARAEFEVPAAPNTAIKAGVWRETGAH